jgi:hypothetical protein
MDHHHVHYLSQTTKRHTTSPYITLSQRSARVSLLKELRLPKSWF